MSNPNAIVEIGGDNRGLKKALNESSSLVAKFATNMASVQTVAALAVMGGTHFVIDRWRLARYVVWISNFAAPPGTNPPWPECTATGFPPDRPPFLTVWILIIVDNLMHIGINAAALTWF